MKLPKVYEPGKYEAEIYELWEKQGVFHPSTSSTYYSMVMPPPNANANLHIGYELTAALEDIAARYHRLKGDSVLLLPGADHAGFETQSVYEKHLAKEGKSRFDFSREELYKQIWDFVALNRSNFEAQMRKMGVSCDWSRFTFTLDEKIVKRAYATFKKMWDEGLIYRGERLVNFCTFHGTAFADIEVIHKEEQSHLWELRYPLVDGSGEVIVATTRPETMLGDTAVAVNPKDKRYKHLIGKTAKLPLTHREVPIIADEFVDMKFGTGAVKITPAHDVNDFEVGKRHDLPFITVINHEGVLADVPEQYRGLTVLEARDKVVGDLESGGFLVAVKDHTHSVGHCYKCDTVIQPLLREQWFIDMEPLAKKAVEALKQGKVNFFPNSKKEQLITYLEGLHDWNISRQIAWGIPIPAFQNVDDADDWIYDERVDEEILTIDGKTYHRDPDVFDTWFSSSSWPFATLDFPEGEDYKNFYPLSMMETGGEILYPWVSRMLMLGLYVTGDVPFREVYIHGYVMAEDGSKMSKSLGNVVDPLPVIEEYGSDALRMGIISGRAAAINRGYDQRKVEDARNFCNKLWNIARYIEDSAGEAPDREEPELKKPADHWIVRGLTQAIDSISSDLEEYRFSEAYDKLYHFVWDELADWYIEASKAEPNKKLLAYILEKVLLIAHPFMPFMTEKIWQTLAWDNSQLLAARTIGKTIGFENTASAEFAIVQQVVTEARFISRALKVTKARLFFSDAPAIARNSIVVQQLARLGKVTEGTFSQGVRLTESGLNVWLDIDVDKAKTYAKELAQSRDLQQNVVKQLEGRLANKQYVDNAPLAVVNQTKDQLRETQEKIAALENEIVRFTS